MTKSIIARMHSALRMHVHATTARKWGAVTHMITRHTGRRAVEDGRGSGWLSGRMSGLLSGRLYFPASQANGQALAGDFSEQTFSQIENKTKQKCTSERTKDFVGFPMPSSLHVTFNKFKFKFETLYSISNNGPSPIGCICNQSIMHKYNAFVHASITFLFIFLVISSRTVGFYRYIILGNIKLCIFISLK